MSENYMSRPPEKVGASVAPSTSNTSTAQTIRPKLRIFHANPKGTGCAAEFTLHPAHDITDGSIWLRLANQMTIGDRQGPQPVYPRFDWENSICVKFEFSDLIEILQVFRGECESIASGKGLFHISTVGRTRIALSHTVETGGYFLDVYRKLMDGHEVQAHLSLSSAEALGLMTAIEQSLGIIAFGIPMVIPHDTTAYKAKMKELRRGSAA